MNQKLDFEKIGQRIKDARKEKGLNQAQLGELVGCSNNHISHIEVGQTKVSLSMLLSIALSLDKDLDYFLMDTPFVRPWKMVDLEILQKIEQFDPISLITLNGIIDAMLNEQKLRRQSGEDCLGK